MEQSPFPPSLYFPEGSPLTGLATELFKAMDNDDSGFIDTAEFLHAVWKLQQSKEGSKTRLWNGHPTELFEAIDTNHNNRLDMDEWMSYLKGMWEALGETGLRPLLEVHIKKCKEATPPPSSPPKEHREHHGSHLHRATEEQRHAKKEKSITKQKDPFAVLDDETKALFHAAELGQAAILRELLSDNADPNVRGEQFGDTALQLAAKGGKHEAVKALIEAGADLDMVTVVGASALMLSASHGHKKVVHILLESKADTSFKNAMGDTVLSIAEEANQMEIVELLKQYGAEPGRKHARPEWEIEVSEEALLPTTGDLRDLLK